MTHAAWGYSTVILRRKNHSLFQASAAAVEIRI